MLDSERAIVPFQQIPRDLNCVTILPELSREHLIPFANHPPFRPHLPVDPSCLPACISTKSVCRESKYKEAIVEIR